MSQNRSARLFVSIVVVGASIAGGGACSSATGPDDAGDAAPDWWSHIATDTGPGDIAWWPDISAPRDAQDTWWTGIGIDTGPPDSGVPPTDAADTTDTADAPDGGD